MNALAIKFEREGHYLKALQTIDESATNATSRLASEIQRAYLLERVGRYAESRAVLNTVSRSRVLTATQRSVCEHTLGKIDWEEGDRRSALAHLTQAVHFAERSADLNERVWPQMSLLLATSHTSSTSETNELLSRLRSGVLRLGDPRTLAALHETLGRIEGKRGLVRNAKSHFRRAQQLLDTAPNVYLQALVELEVGVLAGLELDVESAIAHTRVSLELAEQSGSLRLQRASLANLGFCLYLVGDFGSAVDHLHKAESVLAPSGDTRDAILETLARIRLTEDSLGECAEILEQIEGTAVTPDDRLLWAQRHASLTRTRLFARRQNSREALRQAERTLDVARRAQDHLLHRLALLEKSHILLDLKQPRESLETLKFVTALEPNQSPELHAQYEVCIARALASENRLPAATVHLERSKRILAALRAESSLIEASKRCVEVTSTIQSSVSPSVSNSERFFSPQNAIQAVAALLMHSGRPFLAARALIDLLTDVNCVARAAITGNENGYRHTLITLGDCEDQKPETFPIRVCVGSNESSFDLWLEPLADAESTATVNAIVTLVSAANELERSRLEHEQQMRLWPIEDVDLMNEHAVVSGTMRDLMTKARRVATTKMTVLVTGESGTGKEIFARAIHTFSGRGAQPFVPFNCAALPRDMIESQLFGHRRGAFTGADRDNSGVIRAAQGGTLFLDEIGELSIDLQPKLLRFLESGEICPLGETMPFIVDVRIVAATNAKLEQAVKEGRFREDLFYRLHGVPLEIPPLRDRRDELPALVQHFLSRAVIEFSKGNIRIAEDTMERLLLAPWPGNIRQLQNELRRMVALAEPDSILTQSSLSPEVAGAVYEPHVVRDVAPPNAKLNPTLERIEREMVKAALHKHRGKMDDAAKALGISRKGLYLKRQRLGL